MEIRTNIHKTCKYIIFILRNFPYINTKNIIGKY